MPIAQYSRQFWFPSGVLSANIPARVFPLNSNALATLWADAAGTIPLANPVTTDINGTVAFYAEEGEYWIHIDAEAFRVAVGSPDVDLFETAGGTLSTGVLAGGEISVNGLSSSAIDIQPLTGYVVDNITNPDNPIVTRVRKNTVTTVEMDAPALARAVTYWLLDSAGTVIQQAAKPDGTQQRTHILLGVTAHTAGVIGVDQTLPVILPGVANQLTDLMDSLGSFNISGNQITANGVNLRFNQTAGKLFARAFNHFQSGVLTNNPHVSTTVAQTPATFIQILRNTVVAPALTQTLDVANYDNAGVITPVGGGAGSSTILRVFMFANNAPAFQIIVQYGQTVYSSLSAAVAAVGAGTFVTNPFFVEGNGALIAYIAVTRTAVNLTDSTQAVFVTAGKFATP